MKSKLNKTSIGLACCIAALVAVLSLSLVACNNDNDSAPTASSFVAVDINPSVELVLDQYNCVMSVAAANSDAEVLLWNEDGIVGANVNVAIGKIASLAVEYGYITDENSNISVTVSASASVNADALYNTISTAITTTIDTLDSTIQATVEKAVDLVLEKELADVKAANTDKSGYSDLTVARYRLVKRAMSADRSLKMDAAVLMTNEQLSAIVETAQADAQAKLGKAYQLAVSEASFLYETTKQIAYDAVYPAYLIENLRFADSIHASHYTALTAAYTYLDHYYYGLRDYIDNPIYTLDDAQALYNALATYLGGADYETFKAEITDATGDITFDSISAYINRIYRNLPQEDREAFDSAYTTVKSTVLDILRFDVTLEDNGIQAQLTGLSGFFNLNVSIYDVVSVETALEEIKAQIAVEYEAMNLTQEDIEEINNRRSDLKEIIEGYEKDLQDAINSARKTAEDTFNQLKAARKSVEA